MGWQEIAIRLLFAFILGSATAIAKKWYQTKQFIQSNTLMAVGAAMFSILASLTSETGFPSELIIGISIICIGISFQKQADTSSMSIDTVIRLWCAGAVGTMVGLGFLIPAYIGMLIVILTNVIFTASETDYVPYIEKELNNNIELENELESTIEATAPWEIHYQCLVNCWAEDEAEVLAWLVQLGKEKELIPTRISSKDVAKDSMTPKTEIQVDFVSDGKSSPLQLQQVLINLKSKVEVNSASWLNLTSEMNSKNNTFALKKQN